MSSEHIHSHEHSHPHEHTHENMAELPAEKRLALLTYMLDHNRHHAEELHELGHGLDGDACQLIHDAVDLYEQGNDKLEEALNLIKGE